MSRPNDTLVRFGRRVAELRLSQGLTQEEFAHRAGLDRSYIGGIERAKRNVSLLNIYKLAAGLSLPVQALFEGI